MEGATTVNGVNGVKTKAQDLDGAMQRLQSAIANTFKLKLVKITSRRSN
ncbi:hypothetical protein ACVNPX_02315 [Staphylococcus aureus]